MQTYHASSAECAAGAKRCHCRQGVQLVIRREVRDATGHTAVTLPAAENTEVRTLRTWVGNHVLPGCGAQCQSTPKKGQSGADKLKERSPRFQ